MRHINNGLFEPALAEQIYAAIGLELVPAARSAMRSWLAVDAREKRPAHRYTAAHFGLSTAAIREAFADYMDRFSEPAERP